MALVALLLGSGVPAASAAATLPSGSAAAPVATTGGATSLTSSSAILNGIAINSLAGADWGFEYGTSTKYDRVTTPVALGSGLIAVSHQLTGLAPNTLYHFRLYVMQGYQLVSAGVDMTFLTPSSAQQPVTGSASLFSRRVRITRSGLVVRLRCSGPAGAKCPGLVGVSLAPAVKRASLFCAVGSVNLMTSSRVQTVRLAETPACAAALRAAGKRDLSGKLAAAFQGAGKPLESAVRLSVLS